MKNGENVITCKSTATGGGFFELIIINLLITVFTFGIGTPWVIMRNNKFICDKLEISEKDLNTFFEAPKKTYKDYKNSSYIYEIGSIVSKFLGLELGGKRWLEYLIMD